MDFRPEASIGITISGIYRSVYVTTNHIHTCMLWNDNDRRLWENIRQNKTKLGSIKVYDVYWFLGRMLFINLYGHRVWLTYRWIHKFWNKLFVKQDSKR